MNPVISLHEARSGQLVRIVEIHGGRWYRQKLYQMGLFPGTVVKIEMVFRPGPVILSRNRMRLGIGMGMAKKILVQSVE